MTQPASIASTRAAAETPRRPTSTARNEAPSTAGAVVELRDASRAYPTASGAFVALAGLDLVIAAGELVAIVGKSGSGKSTLVNLIAGLDRPTAGRIRVAGTDLEGLDESALAAWRGRHVGVVFQFFQLLPTLTILENVMLPIELCHTLAPAPARVRARELLAQVGIADQADKLPAALSGGQQQRAAIARALANDPPLVIADEPTGNLDSHTADAVLALLAGLTRAGKTVITVTHERDIARFADRVVTLADGQLVDIVRGGREAARG
ncbi:MAG: ABC transporter ATP-binding protein [Kofleriaceae bacterium]